MVERGQPEQASSFEQRTQDALPLRDAQTPGSSSAKNSSDDGESDGEQRGRRTANRGFAAMDREKQKRIASEGGRAAHQQGVAHEWNRDEARQAGRKGGQIVSRNREHMSEIGRKGGQSSGQRRQQNEA